MKTCSLSQWIRATVAAVCIIVLSLPRPLVGCMGSGGQICLVNPGACTKSMVLTKSVPTVVVFPPSGPATFSVAMNLFITCPLTNNCGVGCTNAGAPLAASLTADLYAGPPCPPVGPLPPPVASTTLSTAAATLALPTCAPLGPGNNPYAVPVTVPVGTPPGLYCVVGTASVTFPGGQVLTASGDTVVCLVEAVPGKPNTPRLNLELLTAPFPRMAPGDQAIARYRVTNNDPSNSVQLVAIGTSKQAAVRPQGGNERDGVFTISASTGDDFPIQFYPGAECIPLPPHPYTQSEARQDLPLLGPGQSTEINLGIRSYGQCADGSCSESTLRVDGTFTDGSSAVACAGMSFSVDTSVPSQNCGREVNDCNGNGIPDAIDIATRRSADQNYNAMPDECEEVLNLPVFAGVNPTNPAPGAPIEVRVAFQEVIPMAAVWANGNPLIRTQFLGAPFWTGTIPADSRPGPQTVYFLGSDVSGGLASYIAPYDVISTGLNITANVSGNINGQPVSAHGVGTGSPQTGLMTLDWNFQAVPSGFSIWGSIVTKAGSIGSGLARELGSAQNLFRLSPSGYSIHEVAIYQPEGVVGTPVDEVGTPGGPERDVVVADVTISRSGDNITSTSVLNGNAQLPPLVGIVVERSSWTPIPGTSQFIERVVKYLLRPDGGAPIRVDAVATYTLNSGALPAVQSKSAGLTVLAADPDSAHPTTARIEYQNGVSSSTRLNGLLSSPLGNAAAMSSGGPLVVSNIGSSGQDGVSISLDEAPYFDANLRPVSLAASGASLTLEATGNFGGMPGTPLGRASLTQTGNGLQLASDFSPIGSTQTRVEVYDNGKLVGSRTLPTGGLGTLLGQPVVSGCGKLPTRPIFPPPPPCYWIRGPFPWEFRVPGQPDLAGNELRILAVNATAGIQSLSSFNLRAANIGGSLAISNQTIVDPQGPALARFDYSHVVRINGQQEFARMTGSMDGAHGLFVADARISKFIPGYGDPDDSWVTLGTSSGGPVVAAALNGGLNLHDLTRGNLGHEVLVRSVSELGNVTTLIYVRRVNDMVVANLVSEGAADYPPVAGIVSPLVYDQVPGPLGSIRETGEKVLIAQDGRRIPVSYEAFYVGQDPLPEPQKRTIIMNKLAQSDDKRALTMRVQSVVRPERIQNPDKLLVQYTHNFTFNGDAGSAVAGGLADRLTGRMISDAHVLKYVLGYRDWHWSPVTLQLISVVSVIARELGGAQNLFTLTGGQLGHRVRVNTLDPFADVNTSIQVSRVGDAIVAQLDSSGRADYPPGPGSMASPLSLLQTPNALGEGFTETTTKQLATADGTPVASRVTAVFPGINLSNVQTRDVSVEVLSESADHRDVTLQFDATVSPRFAPSTTVQLPAGCLAIGNNYSRGGNTLDEVLPNVADGAQLFKWNLVSQSYQPFQYIAGFGWEPAGGTLAPGEGAFICSPAAQTIVFTGQIPTLPSTVPRPSAPGLRLVACRAPAACTFEEMMGFPPAIGDKVLKYDDPVNNPGAQPSSTHTFTASGWTPSAPVLGAGRGAYVDLVASKPPATFGGVMHTPIGNATVQVSSNELVVGNLGSSGQDGVSVELGDAQFGIVTFDGIDPATRPTGATVNMRVIGNINGKRNQLFGTLRSTDVGDATEFWCDFGPIGAVAATALVYDGSKLVSRVSDIVGTVARIPGPIICDPWDPYWPMGGRPWAIIGLPNRPTITLTGGTPVPGDRLVVIPQASLLADEAFGPRPHPWDPDPEPWNPDPSPWGPTPEPWNEAAGPWPVPWQLGHLSRLEILASNVGKLRILKTEVGQFHHPHTAVGQARLVASGETMQVANIPATGNNGVDVALSHVDRFQVRWNRPDPEPAVGSFLQASARGAFGGGEEQILGSLNFAKTAAGGILITPDYTPIGSARQRVEIWRDGALVSTTFVNNTIAASVPRWPGGCGKEGPPIINPPGPIILCIVADWYQTIPFVVGGQQVLGDQLRVLADNPPAPLDYLSTFSLRLGGGFPGLTLVGEESGQSGLWFQGVAHLPLGKASLAEDAGVLTVGNIGSSGEDGVSMALGDAGFGVVTFDRLDADALPTGAAVNVRAFGTLDGVPDQFIGTLRATDVGNSIQYWCDFSPIGGSNATALVYDGPNVVARLDNIVGPVATVPGAVVCDRWDPVWPMGPRDPWALIDFPDRPVITLTGGQGVQGDRLVVIPRRVNLGDPSPQPSFPTITAVSRLEILGLNVGSFRIIQQDIGAFHHRHQALGQARLLGHGDDLRLNNLVSSADNPDGVRITLTDANRFSALWRPLDAAVMMPTGAMVRATSYGSFGGEQDQLLGSIQLSDLGSTKLLTADYSPINAFSRRVEVVRNGQVVATLTGNTGIVARVPDWPIGCGKSGPPWRPPILCFWWRWYPNTWFELGNGLRISGDEIRVLAEDQTASLDRLSQFDIQAAGISEINFVSEQSSRASVEFGGMPHVPLGTAQLTPDPASGALIVDNLGSSGQDGVRIDLGETEFNIVQFDPGHASELLTGAYMKFTTLGVLGGVADQAIWSLKTEDVGEEFGLSFDSTAVRPARVRVEARLGNKVVASRIFSPPPKPEEIFVRFRVDGCWVDPVWPMGPEVWAILAMVNPGPITIAGLNPVTADRIVVAAMEPKVPVGRISATLLQSALVPSFKILKQVLGEFELPHRAMGQARLSGQQGVLRVSNIGSSGQDGVAIELDHKDRVSARWFDLDPFGLVPSGAFLEVSARGAFGGQPEQHLGSVRIEDMGEKLEITADYTPVGVETRHIEVLNAGQVVATLDGNSGIVARVPSWPGGCGKLAPPILRPWPPILCIWLDWPQRIPFELGAGIGLRTASAGGQTVEGDEIRILAENPPAALDYLSEFSLRAAGIPQITLIDETAGLPELHIARFGFQVTISWNPAVGTLEAADEVTGPWTAVQNAGNPHTINASAARRFYRVRL